MDEPRSSEPKPAGDIIAELEFDEKFRKMAEATKIEDARFSAWKATQNCSGRPCSIHPDFERQFDELTTRLHPDGQGWVQYLAPCKICQTDERIARCGVQDVLSRARFESFIPSDESEKGHVEKVQEFVNAGIGFLILIGAIGTGKSHLAVSAMRAFRRPVFVKQSTLLLMLRETYQDRAAIDPIHLCQSTSLLVLDEIGLTAGGRDELPMLHEILDFRYGHRKPTILTCNVGMEELREVLGDRMIDRLKECCFAALSFGGKSHRPDAKSRYFDNAPSPNKRTVVPWWESVT